MKPHQFVNKWLRNRASDRFMSEIGATTEGYRHFLRKTLFEVTGTYFDPYMEEHKAVVSYIAKTDEFDRAKSAIKESWVMLTNDNMFYLIEPSAVCKPEDHGNLNPHVVKIKNLADETLWIRPANNDIVSVNTV
jgi:hypothetical protein